MPGIVCAAVDGLAAYSVGPVGIPWAFTGVLEAAFNFAEDAGTGRKTWAGVGFAGSRGGAFILDFGIDAMGWEWSTSFLK